ncbi:MAG: hypothetical protein K0Q73_8801 [Paenibacillus sp.]|nr:hypothetical protein [Paenibacillus sp.]
MINPRFQPGGDKYESIREDDRRAFYEKVEAEQAEIIEVLKSVVSTWTENEWEEGSIDEMRFNRFLIYHPEWDHEELYATISEEMERVLGICEGRFAS